MKRKMHCNGHNEMSQKSIKLDSTSDALDVLNSVFDTQICVRIGVFDCLWLLSKYCPKSLVDKYLLKMVDAYCYNVSFDFMPSLDRYIVYNQAWLYNVDSMLCDWIHSFTFPSGLTRLDAIDYFKIGLADYFYSRFNYLYR